MGFSYHQTGGFGKTKTHGNQGQIHMDLTKRRYKRFMNQSLGSIRKCSNGTRGGSRGYFWILGKGLGRIVDAEWMPYL